MDNDRLTNPEYVWNQLDYRHDAIIEASAGTGKTYALESIVLKLICDKDKNYDPREILLVTFTEKAAGELKNRVRDALDKAGKLPPDFDEMMICTIHSFCRQLLTEYAFENGVPMQCEVGNDSALAHQAVREALKDAEFMKMSPEGLFTALEEAHVKSIGELIKDVEEKVANTDPQKWRAVLEDAVAKAENEVIEAHKSLCDLGHGNIGKYVLDGAVLHSGKTNPAFFNWLKDHFDELAKPSAMLNLEDCPLPKKITDIDYSIRKWQGTSVMNGRSGGKLFDSIPDCKPKIEAIAIALGKLEKAKSGKNQKELAIQLLKLAIPRFEKLKKTTALLTFNDMVSRAAAVVTNEPETEEERDVRRRFFDSVRAHYRVALVDEFQDTDDKQWGIFHKLFSAENNKVKDGKPGFLLVVGDPKQSIYSFRGADVGVYCKARDEITVAGGDDSKKSLDVTYRATRPLVNAFNVFFRDGADGKPRSDWFKDGAAGEGIPYDRDVEYPKEGNPKFDGLPDDGVPVRLLESMPARVLPGQRGGFGNKNLCLPVFMENAAKEMEWLAAGDPERSTQFKYGDMCVLVDTKNDAAVVRRILAKHRIPYGQYKQQGLYDSAETEGVLALLDYLASPNGSGNRSALLLSPLFGIHPSKLPAFNKFPAFDALIESLQDLASKKKWNELFEAVMSDPCTALVSPRGDVCAFNRTRAAVRQLFDKLLSEKGRLATTLADFAAALRSWRKDDKSAGEDGALYKKESDADRVKIMTMHASKGLEFPVVFLAYGFSPLVNAKKTPDKDEWPAIRQERRRLVYVALTRAERLLYLPWSKRVESKTSGIGSKGSALSFDSPDCAFLGSAINTYFTTEGRSFDDAFPAHGESKGTSADAERGDGAATNDRAGDVTDVDGNEDIPDVDVPERLKWFTSLRFQWDSFSSLPHSAAGETPPPPPPVKSTAEEKDGGGNDENYGESVESVPEPGGKKNLLPSGNVSGSAFHEIMEELCKNDSKKSKDAVDFQNACDEAMAKDDSPLMALIRKKMRKFSIRNRTDGEGEGADSTENVLQRMVRHALETIIDVDGHPFQLREIPHEDRLAEVEFVGLEQKLLRGLPEKREGALNGAIDLLVRKDGRVYIIDWKTNTLQDYGKDSVDAAMDKAGYRLQYRLYALAVDAWLKGHGYALAGAAYLFVRGGENGEQSAVYKESFGGDGVERFRKEIAQMGYFGANIDNTDKENQ